MKKLKSFLELLLICVLALNINLNLNTKIVKGAELKEIPLVNSSKFLIFEPNSKSAILNKANEEIINTDLANKLLSVLTALDFVKTDDLALVSDKSVEVFKKYETDYKDKVIGVKKGESLSILDLIKAVLYVDSQDALSVLAISSKMSEDDFFNAMNKKAESLKLEKTTLGSLFIQKDNIRKTTLNDLVKIFKELVKHKNVVDTGVATEFSIPPNNFNTETRKFRINNPMADKTSPLFYSDYKFGVLGTDFDNGSTVFISLAQNSDQSIISAFAQTAKSEDNFKNTKILDDYAFNNFKSVKLIDSGTVLSKYELQDGNTIDLVNKSDFYVLRKTEEDIGNKKYSTKIKLNPLTSTTIKKGDVLGSAEVVVNDKTVGNVDLISTKEAVVEGIIDPNQNNTTLSTIKSFFQTLLFTLAILTIVFMIYKTLHNIKEGKRRQRMLRARREEQRRRRREKINFNIEE